MKYTTQDNFTWYTIEPHVARILHDADYCVYELHNDDSESLCVDGHEFSNASGVRYAIETPSNDVIHCLCGENAIAPFIDGNLENCFDAIFSYRTADITFFGHNDELTSVLKKLSKCGATMSISPAEFLSIIEL